MEAGPGASAAAETTACAVSRIIIRYLVLGAHRPFDLVGTVADRMLGVTTWRKRFKRHATGAHLRPTLGTNFATSASGPGCPRTVRYMSHNRLTSVLAIVSVMLSGIPARTLAQSHEHQHEPTVTGTNPMMGGSTACAPIGADCTTEEYLLGILDTRGVSAAMASLDSLAARDEALRRDGHQYAHAIGINAFSGNEEVGAVFARCTPAFQSGCYHGVIQSYFTSHIRAHGGEVDVATINGLCEAQRGGDRWLLFQCAHGMGHGTYMVAGNHLPDALAACDLAADDWERESCYGGAFMENIVNETTPHHGVGRPDAEATAGHGDHHATPTLASGPAREPFPALDRDDPHYPCSVLAARYLVACYQMQTSVMLWFNGTDVADAARSCGEAPEHLRRTCFQSLGRDVSSITLQDNDRAVRLCSNGPVEYRPWCHLGYAKNLVDVTADPADGFAYCRILPRGESKRICNVAIGEQIWVLAEDPARRAEMCLAAEADFQAACRRGAGLDPESTAAAQPAGRG